MADPSRDESLSRAIRGAFLGLNRDALATLATLSLERRLAMVTELADFARASYAAQARMAHPHANADEIEAKVRQRMLERHAAE